MAYNMAGNSIFTNEASTMIPTGAPYEPAWLGAEYDWTRHAVHLTWTDSSDNEEHFVVERKSDLEPEWQQIVELWQNLVFYYDSNVSGERSILCKYCPLMLFKLVGKNSSLAILWTVLLIILSVRARNE